MEGTIDWSVIGEANCRVVNNTFHHQVACRLATSAIRMRATTHVICSAKNLANIVN
jgi:hypothetical protein